MPASWSILEKRGELLRKLREFFYESGFVEVETPLVSREAIPELHIEPPAVYELRAESAPPTTGLGRWLQASPEAHMKRLMADGAQAIFQVTRSFRSGEQGRHHNPEFTIVEWYRRGDDMDAGMRLLDELCQVLLGTQTADRTAYATAFEKRLRLDPHLCSVAELRVAAKSEITQPRLGIREDDRDFWLHVLWALAVEPGLGRKTPEIIYDWPASQASLARIRHESDGRAVSERFELYWKGVELANGFHELSDAGELRARLEEVNRARAADGRTPLPLPERLLTAMETGLPDCTGCALGFDRLVMLATGAESLDDVMAFPGEHA